ncbi:MAG: WXG100 family type VII secretion target [Clostridia bacterium]|nr:WXG100 family type VII secretion target [Clostridia bacterium]
MAKFRVDSEVLQTKATEVRNIKTEHESVVAKLGTIVTALADVWEGQAYQKFVSDYESIKPTFTRLAETLEKVASDLDKDAAIYADAEARATSNS